MLTKLRILHSFYVFIKEVVLGKATLKQALQYDPRRVYVLGVIIASITLNIITIPFLYKSLEKIVELKAELRGQQVINEIVKPLEPDTKVKSKEAIVELNPH